MCGIAGYFKTTYNNEDVLLKMLNTMKNRGPDDQATFSYKDLHMGSRRLAINDLLSGDQPFISVNNKVKVCYNGEIYNYYELKKFLEKKGYSFKTKCDGEVICNLFQEYGEKSFHMLEGMFAISLWCERSETLFLVRDYIGEKPLYYSTLNNNGVAFGSNINCLKFFFQSPKLNYQGIWDYPTFLWIPEPDTIYENIFSIPKSSFLKVNSKTCKIFSYNIPNFSFNKIKSNKQKIEHVNELVTESLEQRLISDVPIGTFLSGGLDSSIITALVSQRVSDLKTFSVGFENITDPYHGNADESQLANDFSKLLGVENYKIHISDKDALESLNIFSDNSDGPFGVSSGIGVLLLAEEARKLGVKVLLSGDGADEIFGGYSWYKPLNDIDFDNWKNLEENMTMQQTNIKGKELLQSLNNMSPEYLGYALHYYAHELEKEKIFNSETFRNCKKSLRYFNNLNTAHKSIDNYLEHDRDFYFTNEMLRKLDRMCMAFSVESRVPFFSRKLRSFAKNFKFKDFFLDDRLKGILRSAFKEILPESIIKRKKHGFNFPIDYWIKNSKKWKELVLHTFSNDSELFKFNLINRESQKNVHEILKQKKLNGHTLFCYIMLNIWLERSYNGNNC